MLKRQQKQKKNNISSFLGKSGCLGGPVTWKQTTRGARAVRYEESITSQSYVIICRLLARYTPLVYGASRRNVRSVPGTGCIHTTSAGNSRIAAS